MGFVVGLVMAVASLVILIIIAFVVVSTLTGANLLTAGRPTITTTNESFSGVAQGAWINVTGYTLAGASSVNLVSGSFVITSAFNQSSGVQIPATNYSVTAGGVVKNTTTVAPFNNWNNATISYTYKNTAAEEQSTTSLSGNFSSGVNNLSTKIPTVLLIAAIILILGILAVLVGVWQRMRMGGSL